MTQYINGQTKVEDDTAIREILSDFSNAWNKHDAMWPVRLRSLKFSPFFFLWPIHRPTYPGSGSFA